MQSYPTGGNLNQQAASNNTQAIGRPSLMADSGRVADRLLEIHGRLIVIADRLCGLAPTQISQPDNGLKAGPPVETNVARNINTASNWADRIDEQIGRIENGL